ncbi:MAG: hypothetical protein FJW37_08720 [Acidobacteria bacterium]|nr:hypothetical protein [Acidobacteriota bacterium]
MIADLIRQAVRRNLLNQLLVLGAWTLVAALAGLVLLLVLGAEILAWHWLLLMPALCLAIGFAVLIRRLPSGYSIAQLVDRRLRLADTLSTAWFYAGETRPASERLRRLQHAEAERLARTVDLRQALPLEVPWASYAAALLALVVSSLFSARYLMDRRIDLRQPLARVIQEYFGGEDARQTASVERERAPRRPRLDEAALAMRMTDPEAGNVAELDPAPDSALDTIDIPDTSSDPDGPSKSAGNREQKPGSSPQEGEPGEDAQDSEAARSESVGEQEGAGAEARQRQASSGQQQPSDSGQASLSARLREAMSNLLSQMRQQSSGDTRAARPAGERAGNQQARSGQKGQGKEGASDSQNAQAGEAAESAENAQGKGAGESDERSSNQAASGAGKQDGGKDVKLAEQLAAMGKISEIIGKRAANVTGDMTVEVQSSSQQLRTPYSRRNATHGESGGEISRDEVPLLYQAYVQQYFEHVRRGEDRAAPPSAPAAEKPEKSAWILPNTATTRRPAQRAPGSPVPARSQARDRAATPAEISADLRR